MDAYTYTTKGYECRKAWMHVEKPISQQNQDKLVVVAIKITTKSNIFPTLLYDDVWLFLSKIQSGHQIIITLVIFSPLEKS